MLSTLDWIIIAVYLAGVIAIGVLSGGRQNSAEDYFTAEGGFSGMLGTVMVGLSIAATLFSGISFLAYPSIVYRGGASLLLDLLTFPVALVILAYWFLPKYFAGRYRHPYEILEQRFGLGVRRTAAGMFMLLRIGWMAALIYAPTLAIMAAGNLGKIWFWPIVLVLGLSCTFYTTLGGIRGVIVTDAIQFLVIIAGVGLTVGYILIYLPVSFGTAWDGLAKSNHLILFDPSLSFTKPLTFWSIIFGFGVANMSSYIADQMSLQRYLAMGNTKTAVRSFAVNVVGVSVVVLMLAGVGLALHSWYRFVPDANLPSASDKIFPYFIATQLPVGIAGLVLAAILAATMSSMTSGINALAGTITLDFCKRPDNKNTPQNQLRFARIVSIAIGVLSTLAAGLVSTLGGIFAIAQILLGVFLGPLLAVMILAIANFKISGRAVIAGLIIGCLVGWATAFSPIAALWVAPFAFFGALAASFILHWTEKMLKVSSVK